MLIAIMVDFDNRMILCDEPRFYKHCFACLNKGIAMVSVPSDPIFG